MKVLAIDTSNFVLGVALLEENKVVGEYITNLKKNHSVRAMPAIKQLLADCDVKPAELTKIVVAEGPGSYTGVRIGVTIAKTLAWTLNLPLVAVSSLAVQAVSVGHYFDGVISPLFDGRRGQIYTGLYKVTDNGLESIIQDQLTLTVNWAEQLKENKEKIIFVGNDLPIHQQVLQDILGDQALFADTVNYNPRPSILAYLGMNKKAVDSIHTFVPNYVRMAEAEMKWLESNQNGIKEEKA